ncbi:MAG: hypothetical protein IJU52_02645 [Clostridia bacterium]|nr:hypothetical protein [Clostridia bacterium]
MIKKIQKWNEKECDALFAMLRGEGIERLNFTVYGLADYHDRFAGRKGDHELIFRMMKAAGGVSFGVFAQNETPPSTFCSSAHASVLSYC